MKNRLILIEGIPGSGKTTISYKVKEYLEAKGKAVRLYREGDAHPADLAWSAYIELDNYQSLLEKYPELADSIKQQTQIEENHAIVAYTKIQKVFEHKELVQYFEDHEVSDKRVSEDIFKKLHFKRWQQFAENAEKDFITVFECSYLQNHVNELLLFHDKDSDYITDYLVELIGTVQNLNPKLIYLVQPDTCETISRVAKERISPDKSKWQDWIDRVIQYIESSPYGKAHGLKGFDGTVQYFDTRKQLELAILEQLPIEKAIINNPDYNWDNVFNQVTAELEI